MRLSNEYYSYRDKKTGERITSHNTVNCWKDVLGNDLKIGSLVIWQPYSSQDGMHVGKIINRRSTSYQDWFRFVILTADKKRIDRYGWELVSYLPQVVKHDFEEE